MRVGTRPRPRYELLHKEIQKHYEPLQMANGMGEEGIKFFKNLSPPQAQHAASVLPICVADPAAGAQPPPHAWRPKQLCAMPVFH